MVHLCLVLVSIVYSVLHVQLVNCQGFCQDRKYQCKQWARAGECDRNVNFMETNCCKSCRNACRDKHPDCGKAAKKGLCSHHKILSLCHMSCGMCCSDYAKRCTSKMCSGKKSVMCLRSCRACASPCSPCTNAMYNEHYKIEGFTIRAESGTFYRWPLLTKALKEDLKKLKTVVPKPAAIRLQAWSGIYVSKLKLCGSYPACKAPGVADQYHVSRRWLAQHNEAPQKAGFVDMSNPGEYLVRRSMAEKYNLLHEFFHAWMDIRRRAGLAGDRESDRKVKRIKAAWQRARRSVQYQRVPYGNGGYRQAYAITSEWEFMGELSEAYFARGNDRNDYYPYNRQQLRQFDPVGFAAIHDIWSPPYPNKIAVAGTGA